MTTPDNPYRIHTRFDTSDCTVLVVEEHCVLGVWTVVNSIQGTDLMIGPDGRVYDATFLDSRGGSPAEQVLAWLGDQDL